MGNQIDAATGKIIFNNTADTTRDLQALADRIDEDTTLQVATVAALDSVPRKRPGMMRRVAADKSLWQFTGSGWSLMSIDQELINAVPLSGAVLDSSDPLQLWSNGQLALLTGTINVTASGSTWQQGWNVCDTIPTRFRPKKQVFLEAKSGSAFIWVKITTTGVVTVDTIWLGSTANWLLVAGKTWPLMGL